MIFLTFFLGLIANFIGYIPPGNINLTLTQLTINRGMRQALRFITAFSSVEFIFTIIIMQAAEWLAAQKHVDTIIDWVMIVLFSVMGTITWINRNKPPKAKYNDRESIRYGILLGFINPMQIPFWMIAGTYLLAHHWILPGMFALVIFSLGSAAGSFLCLYLYARSAKYIQSKFALSTQLLNKSIAILFFSLAAYHIVKQIYVVFFKH
ncbi:lysine transporter LysE [Mucilaginibacter daejeonensis]|uniref:LysE family translocator n=1 Tax=Mucilaginibacter daejeonensis TaxID=398049 RepID=UPI001D17014F|nr:lysine transporter LysE [Mucilaginibacter daejeonensis]UEG53847.1 lysine transporter LysE [Mucilaginibacter daejeonensis]